MTTPTNSSDIHREVSLITINTIAQTPLKLTSTNYISWKLQFETLFIGYDLIRYIDGSVPCPPNTITADNTTVPNPSHELWIRQDQLLLNAIINSFSPTIIPFIACAGTAKDAWNILANTYAKPSRGHIQQVKNKLKNPIKGTQTITEFLHSIKAHVDELAILGAPVDSKDLTDKILDGLGDEYKELVRAIQARDTPISFDELHEKLLSFEAHAPTDTWLRPFPLQPIPCTGQPLHGVPLVSTILDPFIPHLPLLTSGVSPISDLPTHHSTTLPIARISLHRNHIKVFAKFVAFKVTQPNDVPPSN